MSAYAAGGRCGETGLVLYASLAQAQAPFSAVTESVVENSRQLKGLVSLTVDGKAAVGPERDGGFGVERHLELAQLLEAVGIAVDADQSQEKRRLFLTAGRVA